MGEVVYAPQFGGRSSRAERVGTVARVLIVDSDPATLAAASQALQSEGHATATAFDSLAAIAVAERLGPFDVLVTDVGAIDGMALSSTLRQRDSNLQVLYVMNRRDNRVPLFVDDHQVIERPFSESELIDAVSSLLYWRSPRSTR
jgi:DNA-binding response OmpR family regulator